MSVRYCPTPGCHRPYYVGQTCHGYHHSQGLISAPGTSLREQIIQEEIMEERIERQVEADIIMAEVAEEIVEDVFGGGGFDGDGW